MDIKKKNKKNKHRVVYRVAAPLKIDTNLLKAETNIDISMSFPS